MRTQHAGPAGRAGRPWPPRLRRRRQVRPTAEKPRGRARAHGHGASGASWPTRCCSRARCGRRRRCRWWPRSARGCCASLKDEGSRVAAGEVLAVLDETDYRLSHERAQGRAGRGGGQQGARRGREGARGQPAQDGRHHGQGPPVRPGRRCRWRRRRWPRRGRRPRSPAQQHGARAGAGALRRARGQAPRGRRAPCWPRARPLFTLVDDARARVPGQRALGRLRQGEGGRRRWTSRWTRCRRPAGEGHAWRA